MTGCAFPEAEQGFSVARIVALRADLPLAVAGTTINRFCGSSMTSAHMAAGQIALGAGETAENVARKWQIPRAEQEAFALKGHVWTAPRRQGFG